ncbi:MAG: methyltransferase domain-containing protein [Verrucomicrobiaceae bacterium]
MTKSECPPEEIQRIAALCTTRWHRDYTRIKLRTDPAYAAVLREVSGTRLPLLDIGCGIGLLAMYLRGAGFDADVTGFDYDTGKIAAAKLMAQRSGFSGLHYAAGDARHEMPAFSGHVVILDILQFFTSAEQDTLLALAASRVAAGGRLIIRSGLCEKTWRHRVTIFGDWLAKLSFWMKAAPVCYPTREQFERVLSASGLRVRIQPLWGRTPFNNYLIVAERQA